MNPDVAAAVDRLRADGVLTAAQAAPMGRVARGELVSVRPELRLLLYGGVLAVMGGVGRLVQENLDRIGPVVLAAGLWIAAAAVLAWSLRQAPPFSWGEAPSTHLAFDYLLLLGVLLTGAALAYTEVKFTPLGDLWSYHLLAMSVFTGVLAFRGDSRMVFGIALSTFAAWRGVSASPLQRAFWSSGSGEGLLRWNAALTGLLFVALGLLLVRAQKKAHFEPVAMHLGWLLVLGAILSGLAESGEATFFRLALLLVGLGLAVAAFLAGRFPLFGMGFVAAYIGLSALVATTFDEMFGFLWFSSTGIGVVVILIVAQRLIHARR